MDGDDFWLQIGRKAHELSKSHGSDAWRYATRLAEKALEESDTEEHRFWKAVADSLRPRTNSN